MHTWLPDAHAEAPAPVSAMMSGVLLAVALYAIVRWKGVVSAAVGPAFPNRLLVLLGILSLTIAAFSLVMQRNYKRMLAYSSIEHMGLMCVGLALGAPGAIASMLHLLNHTLAKAAMFLLAGRVLARYRTTDIAGVSGLLRSMPGTGGLFLAGTLALVGLPPFGLFLSELALLRAGFAIGRPWLMGIVLALLTVACVGLVAHANRMLYGPPTAGVVAGERGAWRLAPLAACLARARRPGARRAGAAREPAPADRRDRRPMTNLEHLAAGLSREFPTGVTGLAAPWSPRAPVRGGGRRRARTGAVAGRELRRRAHPDGRRRPPARCRAVRGALPVRPRSGELVRPRDAPGLTPTGRRSRRWPPSTIRPPASSGSCSTSWGSGPSGTRIPARWSGTRSGRRTTSRSARMRPRASSATTDRPFPSSRSAARASTRSRWGRCTPASSSPATSASAWWARRSST